VKQTHVAAALLLLVFAGAMRETPPQGQQRRALPGDLTKPIDQYTGDEFFALVNGLNYTGGQERARRCSGNPGCGNALRTNVRVDAVAGEDSISTGNLPQFGVVAMKAVVRGNQTEAMYGMQSTGPNGRFSYYLIVMRGNTPGTGTWRLEELSIQGNTRTHRMLTQGRFTPCNHPYVAGARADFRTCAQAGASAAGQPRFLNASFGSSAQGTEPPFWIGCASGCCTADGIAGGA
jgi:hypothetical protein